MTKNARFIWVAALILIIMVSIPGCSNSSNKATHETETITLPLISNVAVNPKTYEATVSWTTDKPTMGEVVYGTNANYGLRVETTDYTTSHSVILSGLSPGTTYQYNVKATDINGNTVSFGTQTFTTTALPSISNLNVAVGSTEATVSWTTDKPTMGEVVYGTNAKKATDFDYTTSHSVTLSGLYPGTMYHYKVRATDIDGNTVSSSTQVFTAFRYDYYYHYDHYYYYDHHRSLPHQNYHYDHHYDHYYRSYRR